ncbi:hypothetical protein [Kineococcus rhizosphaerae]|uniref:DUF4345 domain-containing protein n=1 Tax=Kineococcus rhizosphaerae TaxID=559628 RepID=A0A2T0QXB6_9ACTN|nr:hypothetical protein [Kineococcus rhizosphaerae]PRY10528.1 hypothetical protein CLV37_11681 [Kineococcus rhizosphaerae]
MRRTLLGLLTLLGAYVGIWSAFFPLSFYRSFPGPFGSWISMDGPFNEHLVRDVGTFNLGLAAASAVAARHPGPAPARVVAVAWIVYSVPHLAYHLRHLGHLSTVDAVAQVVSLSSTLVLALPLLLPARQDRGEIVAR